MAPFYGWGSSASRLEPLRGGSLLFKNKFKISQNDETWHSYTLYEKDPKNI